MQRIQEGDEQALLELMSRHKEAIFRLAWRYTLNQQDAEEIAEETFVRAYFKAGRFRPKALVKTWLYTITANLCRDLLRRRKKEGYKVSMESTLSATDPRELRETLHHPDAGVHQSVESGEQVEIIENAILTLPHKLRFPLVFCTLDGNSHDACARVLQTSRKSVETRIYRARQRLRTILSAMR